VIVIRRSQPVAGSPGLITCKWKPHSCPGLRGLVFIFALSRRSTFGPRLRRISFLGWLVALRFPIWSSSHFTAPLFSVFRRLPSLEFAVQQDAFAPPLFLHIHALCTLLPGYRFRRRYLMTIPAWWFKSGIIAAGRFLGSSQSSPVHSFVLSRASPFLAPRRQFPRSTRKTAPPPFYSTRSLVLPDVLPSSYLTRTRKLLFMGRRLRRTHVFPRHHVTDLISRRRVSLPAAAGVWCS